MTTWTGAKITDKGYEALGYGHWVTFKTKKGRTHVRPHEGTASEVRVPLLEEERLLVSVVTLVEVKVLTYTGSMTHRWVR